VKGKKFLWLVLAVFFVLTLRLLQLQVIEAPKYKELSERNRLRFIPVNAPRGRVFDSKGRVMATNRPSFDLVLIPADIRDPERLAKRLSELVDVKQEKVLAKLREVQNPFEQVRVKKDLSFEEVSRILGQAEELEGVDIRVTPLRVYPYGETAAHVLGILGEISPKELRTRSYEGYMPGDVIGKSGIEAQWEPFLKGKKGGKEVEVNARGKEIRLIREIPPQGGCDLYLTLDLDLQRKAEELLDGRSGAIVAMDPRDGRILAMASSPSFDPNVFSKGITPQEWRKLVEHPEHPLTNRTIQGIYHPGSVFKVVVALAAIKEGILTPEERITCEGEMEIGNRTFRCWKEKGHGSVDLYRAIVESCDIYFYKVGLRLGPSKLLEWAKAFGLGCLTGVDLPGERGGILPNPKRGKWFAGDTAALSIGQGPFSVTPLQALNLMASIANGGTLYEPFLVLEVKDPTGGSLYRRLPKIKDRLPLDQKDLEIVKKALEGVVEDRKGTGRVAWIKEIKVAGKTGTAQVVLAPKRIKRPEELPYKLRDHAWFVAYAPADHPSFAVAVLVEHGGSGGQAAAPLARELIKYWFGIK